VLNMKCQKLFDVIDLMKNEFIQFWIDVCNIESPTEYKEGVDRCSKYFIEMALSRGWKVDIHEEERSGNCVCITLNPESTERPVVFSSHLDTVHPIGFFGTPPTHCDNEKIYGPGVTDCKGGAVAAFLAMAALEGCGFTGRPIKLLLQSDEENGSRNSNKNTVKYMCEQSKDAVAFLNGEGYISGRATTSRKGISKYIFEITGHAVHSSKCYIGANAIAEAAYKIIELEKLKSPDGLTCNCGLISGGTAENTVAERCTFTADIRFTTNEEKKQAEKLIKKIANTSFVEGTECTVKLASYRVAMEYKAENEKLLEEMNRIYKENGLPVLTAEKGTGGADASDLSAFGIPTVDSLGVEGGNIHSINEFAYLASLAESAKRMAAVAYCI